MGARTKVLVGVATAVVLGVVGIGLLVDSLNARSIGKLQVGVLGHVGDYQVRQTDVDLLNSTAKLYGATDADVVKLLLNINLYQRIGRQYGLSVSNADVSSAVAATATTIQAEDAYVHASWRAKLWEQKLRGMVTGELKGKFVITPFDQNLPVQGGQPSPQVSSLSPAQLTAVQLQDKAYATNLIQSLYAKLQQKQLTFDQAMAAQQDDPKLGVAVSPNAIQSGTFDTNDTNNPGSGIIGQPAIRTAVEKLQTGAYTQPVVCQSVADLAGKKLQDGSWAIVQLTDRVSQNKDYNTFDSLVAAFKAKFNYRVAS